VTVQNGVQPPPPTATVSSSIAPGSEVSGTVQWQVTLTNIAASSVNNVSFIVDGTTRATVHDLVNGTATAAIDTTTLANGTHTFLVTVSTTSGNLSTQTQAQVSNQAPVVQLSFTVSQTLATLLSGKVPWSIGLSGITSAQVASIVYAVDGATRFTVNGLGYPPLLDTTTLANGMHSFTVTVTAVDGTSGASTIQSTVRNG
jgi:hypothetical protein